MAAAKKKPTIGVEARAGASAPAPKKVDLGAVNRFNSKHFRPGPNGTVVGKNKWDKLAQMTGVPPGVLKDLRNRK